MLKKNAKENSRHNMMAVFFCAPCLFFKRLKTIRGQMNFLKTGRQSGKDLV